ncbi:MAG: thioredoxin family protein [Planctomycetes bacterium]|nr:thioredoxin family protein [Planctomycetota bacterium]
MLEQLSTQMVLILLEATIKATLMVGVVMLILVVFRRISVHAQHRIWTIVLVTLLLLPLPGLAGIYWSLPLSVWPSDSGIATANGEHTGPDLSSSSPMGLATDVQRRGPAEIDHLAIRSRQSHSGHAFDIDEMSSKSEVAVEKSFDDTAATSVPFAASHFESVDLRSDTRWPSLFVFGTMVWSIGVGLMLVRLLMAVVHVRRMKQSSLPVAESTFPANVIVRESGQIDSPVVLGCWRTCILLPRNWRDWSLAKRSAVFAHELAHVRRRDPQIGLFAELAVVLFWFHPVSWLVRRRLAQLAELACDQSAAVAIGDRVAYARHLVEIAAAIRPRVRFPLGTAMARKSVIVKRVHVLLDETAELTERITGRSSALIRLFGIPAAIMMVAVHPMAAPSQDQPVASQPPGLRPAKSKLVHLQPRVQVDGPILTIRGTILRPDGSVAKDAVLEQSGPGDVVSATIRDGQYEIRSTGTLLNPPSILCRNPSGSLQSLIQVGGYTLRSDCQTAKTITLAPTKIIRVKVTDEQKIVDSAHVQVEAGSFKYLATTGTDGVAELRIPQQESVFLMSAWTDDHRIGGMHVARKPTREKFGYEFEVEVSSSPPVRVRVVDAQQKPLENVPVEFVAVDGEHGELFVGNNPTSSQTTDVHGDAVFNWVPKWAGERGYFTIADGSPWRRVGDGAARKLTDGLYEFQVAPSRSPERIVVESQLLGVTSDVSGMLVEFWSFEGEEEDTCDVIYSRCDSQGRFSARLLPDSEYGVYVNDRQWVSNSWEGIVVSKDGGIQKPELKLTKGTDIEVLVTRGSNEEPLKNAWLAFESDPDALHGRRFWGRTDEHGRFTAPVLAGTLKIRAGDGDWESTRIIEVVDDEPVKVQVHRKYTVKQTISGRLILPTGVSADLSKTTVKIAGMDGESSDSTTVRPDATGNFTAGIMASRFSILASSEDGKLFGSEILDLTDKTLEVSMFPTVPFVGQVVGPDDRPISGVTVSMRARLVDHQREYPPGTPAFNHQFVEYLDDRTATTDANGQYAFPSTPNRIQLEVDYTRPGETESAAFHRLWLEPGENRPKQLIRLAPSRSEANQSPPPLEPRIADTLQNCRVTGINALVIVTGGGDLVAPFVARHVLDEDDNEELADVYYYLPRTVDGPEAAVLPDRKQYFETHKWPFPATDSIFLVAMNGAGTELGRLSLDVTDQQLAASRVISFLKTHRPEQRNAKLGFEAALVEARKTGRRVWVCAGGTRCAPCYSLSRWFDAQQELLSRDFVLFKFDASNDLNGYELSVALKFDAHGIPCHAILDADGKELINSIGPIGNVGSPVGSVEGQRHLKKMLQATAQKLSSDGIESLVRSLDRKP